MALTPEVITEYKSVPSPEIPSDPDEVVVDYSIINLFRTWSEKPDIFLHRLFKFGGVSLATCSGNPELARMIAAELMLKLDPVMERHHKGERLRRFSDGEASPQFRRELGGQHVIIIQSFAPPREEGDSGIDNQIVELQLAIDAAKRGGAKKITVVFPYLAYARQEKKDAPKIAIATKALLTTFDVLGANAYMGVDVHQEQIAGFTNNPFPTLFSSEFLIPIIGKSFNLNSVVFVAADESAVKMNRAYSTRLLDHPEVGFISKSRSSVTAESRAYSYQGPSLVRKIVISVDDMVAGGGTFIDLARIVADEGVSKDDFGQPNIYCVATHGLLVNGAVEKIRDSLINKLWITNTIRQGREVFNQESSGGKIEVYNAAPWLAEKIARQILNKSMRID
ncbi:MAG: ribose-phosphate diphosphokinase [Patescibacteria group bacterium]